MDSNNEQNNPENIVQTPKTIGTEKKNRVDLASELSQRVDPGKIAASKPVFASEEIKTEKPVSSTSTNQPKIDNSIKVDPTAEPKFRELTEEEKKTETKTESFQGQNYTMPPEAIALMAVSTVDMVQQALLGFVHKKKILTERDEELIEQGVPKPGLTYQMDSEEDLLRQKLERHDRIMKYLGFTEDERKHLVEVTTVYAKTKNIQMSPETALMISFGSVLAQRVGTVLMDK